MNIEANLKRAYITSPDNPTDILGEGEVMWSTLDGTYMVRTDDTGVASEYPSNMVVLDVEDTIPFSKARAA